MQLYKAGKAIFHNILSIGPCIVTPPIQPENYVPKLKVDLKYKDVYIEHVKSAVTYFLS